MRAFEEGEDEREEEVYKVRSPESLLCASETESNEDMEKGDRQ